MVAEATQPAVVNYGPEPGSVELREIPVPRPAAEEVLLEVAAVGVCVRVTVSASI